MPSPSMLMAFAALTGVLVTMGLLLLGVVTLLWNKLDKRFDDLKAEQNQRFDALKAEQNQRFDQVDHRFDEVKAEQNRQFDEVKTEMRELRAMLQEALKAPR